MSLKKKLILVAAATALTAATAIPAMALENEFHGMFGLRARNANYQGGGSTGYLSITGDSATTNNYVEQRSRLFYSAKANDNLKLVTGFELDSTWGKSSYVIGQGNNGGALGADTVNLETKWVYLDFNEPLTGANFKVGIQGLNDAYKGIVVGQGAGADAAGILVSKTVGPFTGSFGWFRLDDRIIATTGTPVTSQQQQTTQANGGTLTNVVATPGATGLTTDITFSNGKATRDFLLLDGKYAVSKDIKVGASYYFLNSDMAQTSVRQVVNGTVSPVGTVAAGTGYDYNVHMVGANAAAAFGPVSVDGFLLYQFGTMETAFGGPAQVHVNSLAANVGAKIKAGPGTAKVNALFVNGGSNFFVNVNNTTSGSFSENALGAAIGNMFILARNPQYTTNDQYMIYESSNRGQGIIGGSLGYDLPLSDKFYVNTNIGFAAVAKDTGIRPATGDSKYQGTEINAEFGYKVYDSLTAGVQAAYVMLGDYYKNSGRNAKDPANPYVGTIFLGYVF